MSQEPGTLEVRRAEVNSRPIVQVRGEVDLRTSPRLRALLMDQVESTEGPLGLDLTEVDYMDSSGVGTLVYVKREVERAGRKLVLIGLQPRVRSVLEITHLDKFFTIVDRPDEVPST